MRRLLALKARVRTGPLAVGATIGGLLLTQLAGGVNAYAAPSVAKATKTVSYQAVHFTVPAAWPVVDLAKQPNTCVRLDQHAVYLGSPGVDQQCPANVRGRTEALIVEPASGVTGTGQTVENPVGHEIVVTGAGVKVTAAYGSDRNTVWQILTSASLVSTGPVTRANVPDAAAPAVVPNAMAPAVAGSASTDLTGQGFDPCSAPSGSAMSAWRASSPYQAIGIYIGGVNRSCAQPNLTASWVSQQASAGWKFIPLYVGLQTSTNSCTGCTLITSPTSDGTNAADDAANQAASLGLNGVVIYYDMESYPSASRGVALQFESAWTSELHARGYKSGIYSSASTGIADLANNVTSYVMPDVVDFASWPGSGSTSTSDPNIPADEWANHQRIHQYSGGHNETYGGYTINIDQDYLDVQVSGTPAPGPARIGVVDTASSVAIKEGGLGAGWVTETSGAAQVALSGTRIGVRYSDGTVAVKDGDLGAGWVTETSGAAEVALSGTRIGVRYSDGTVAVKDGGLGAPWVTETSGVTQLVLSGTRIGVLTTDGHVLVKDGDLGAAWVTVASGATQVALSGTRIGVRYADGTVAVKDGAVGAPWVTETSGAAAVALSDTRVGVLYADGTVVVKDGDLGAAWVTQTSGASQLVLSGTRIGVRYSDGTVVVKDGDLGAGWVTETSGAAQLALSTT
jgi:hypothetical protein